MPYRTRNAQKKDLQYGINFAFGGAGVGKTLSSVPNFSTQVDFFEELIKKAVYSKCDLEHSLTLVTLSGNDYSAFLARGGTILVKLQYIRTIRFWSIIYDIRSIFIGLA